MSETRSVNLGLLDIAEVAVRHRLLAYSSKNPGSPSWRSPRGYYPELKISELAVNKCKSLWQRAPILSAATFSISEQRGVTSIRAFRRPIDGSDLTNNEFGRYVLEAFDDYCVHEESELCVQGLVRVAQIPDYAHPLMPLFSDSESFTWGARSSGLLQSEHVGD